MKNVLLLGAEAIALGALDAGMSGIYAYPGTPSTEITEFVQKNRYALENGIHSDWSANEKTAMESALGMSYAGKRAMVCMKHVGLNVAADPFINSAVTGINGGVLVTVADDPSMHSSQNEQDSRFYADFAMLPVLEPSNQQEAYDMSYDGFELSERFGKPVLIRITTRLSHSRSGVIRRQQKEQNAMATPEDLKQFVLLPSIARKRYKDLLNLQPQLIQASEESVFNEYRPGLELTKGIICSGITINYLEENFPEGVPFPVLKICQYPIPIQKIEQISRDCQSLLILEEGYPLIEKGLRGLMDNYHIPIHGRLDGTIPRDGELNPDVVRLGLKLALKEGPEVPSIMVNRPPALCKGCGHIDTYNALLEAIDQYGHDRTFSDIGCYTLGALPPYNAINSCVDMGASITMAKGAADAGLVPAVAVIGDSTFTHSGMTGLLDIVVEHSPVTVIISDNETTGMTGGQASSALGRIESICIGLGLNPNHVRLIVPLRKNHGENVRVIAEELAYQGPSVVISRRECIQTASKKKRTAKSE